MMVVVGTVVAMAWREAAAGKQAGRQAGERAVRAYSSELAVGGITDFGWARRDKMAKAKENMAGVADAGKQRLSRVPCA